MLSTLPATVNRKRDEAYIACRGRIIEANLLSLNYRGPALGSHGTGYTFPRVRGKVCYQEGRETSFQIRRQPGNSSICG